MVQRYKRKLRPWCVIAVLLPCRDAVGHRVYRQSSAEVRHAQKAKELAPESSYTQDALGWIYCRKGLYQPAAKELEAVLAKETRPSIQFHLGLTYKRLGNSVKGNQ
jgi:tetratricopeptide (TPR) repeat protein